MVVDGEKILAEVLGALHVLQNSAQLDAALSDVLHTVVILQRGFFGVGFVSVIVEHYDFVHLEDTDGSRYLTRQVSSQFLGLRRF